MKKILLFIFSMIALCSYGQSEIPKDSTLLEIQEQIWDIQKKLEPQERYKIYPTENIYVLLRLDTATGRVDIMQWSLDKEKEFINDINSEDLSLSYTLKNGTFELYPTKNMYQFILMDKTNGRCWHLQWGVKISERWIRRMR